MLYKYLWYRVEVFVPAKMKFYHVADHANYKHAVTKAKCAADTAHKFDWNAYSIIEVMNYDEVKRREFYGRR